jgi:carbon dioxide concentrating mechanism protein CcmO
MAHEAIGDGLCTILVRGSLPNVAIAIDAGIHEAERIGELHAVMVIPRPLGDLEDSLPQISLEEEQPLHLPLVLSSKAVDKELEALPVEISTREPLTLELELEVEQPAAPPPPQ